ncbi:Probable transcription factor KAN2 [Linum perenne]
MELFPAQPDLSLQISLPNSKPSSTWRRTSDEDSDDGPLNGFWKRALDSRNTTTTSAAGGGNGSGSGGSFDLSLSNSSSAAAAAAAAPQYYPNHHHFNNVNSSNTNFFRSSPNFPHQQHHNHHHQYQNLNHHHHNYQHHHHHQQPAAAAADEMGYLRPIKGIPLYQNPPPPSSSFHHYPSSTLDTISALARGGQGGGGGGFVQQQPSSSSMMMRSSTRFMSRFPGKRSMRAPRMRWTTTLHARFVHAVELLGGHERATPKSVLELMDVKDLTLAHVKSHLQMYRTVKTTDRAAATSGQSDLVDNGSSGDNSEDLMLDIHNTSSSSSRRPPEPCTMIQQQQGGIRTSTTTPSIGHPQDKDYHHHHNHHHQALWSNSSSREAWLHGKTKDPPASLTSLEKEMDPKCMSYERISDGSCSSSQLSGSRSPQRPNLEFTLGRPH